jgi:hypothetical protein
MFVNFISSDFPAVHIYTCMCPYKVSKLEIFTGSPLMGLLKDESILQSYITNALVPIVRALKPQRGLAIWEIINEPEGSMLMGGFIMIYSVQA